MSALASAANDPLLTSVFTRETRAPAWSVGLVKQFPEKRPPGQE